MSKFKHKAIFMSKYEQKAIKQDLYPNINKRQ